MTWHWNRSNFYYDSYRCLHDHWNGVRLGHLFNLNWGCTVPVLVSPTMHIHHYAELCAYCGRYLFCLDFNKNWDCWYWYKVAAEKVQTHLTYIPILRIHLTVTQTCPPLNQSSPSQKWHVQRQSLCILTGRQSDWTVFLQQRSSKEKIHTICFRVLRSLPRSSIRRLVKFCYPVVGQQGSKTITFWQKVLLASSTRLYSVIYYFSFWTPRSQAFYPEHKPFSNL